MFGLDGRPALPGQLSGQKRTSAALDNSVPYAGIPAFAADNSKIAARWKAQYCKNGVWRGCNGGIERSKEIYSALLALGANPTLAEINKIIGNDTWCSS